MKPAPAVLVYPPEREVRVGTLCGVCFAMYPRAKGEREYVRSEDAAERCCRPGTCDTCGAMGLPEHYSRCSSCAERKRFDAAEKILERDYSGAACDGDEAFADSVDELRERLADRMKPGDTFPTYFYAAEARRWPGVDASTIVESATADLFEEAYDHVEGVDELHAFLQTWNAKQTLYTWHMDRKRVILLDASKNPPPFPHDCADERTPCKPIERVITHNGREARREPCCCTGDPCPMHKGTYAIDDAEAPR